MPKTTKRTETKRAARIMRAHATEMPKLEVKPAPQQRRSPGYKPPARGVARYPWAVGMVVVLIALGVYALYATHTGPFALPAKPKAQVNKAATATALVNTLPAVQKSAMTGSPCNKADIIKQVTDTSAAPTADAFNKIQHSYTKAPAMSIDTNKVYCAGINTNRGLIVLELDPGLAPETVNNFVFLAQNHYYDGIKFHRVNAASSPFMVQTGDPKGDGSGGPGYTIKDEPVKSGWSYTPFTVAMANTGQPNSGGSQFFINRGDNSALSKSYSLFGFVVQGTDVLMKIQGPGDDASSKGITPDVMNHVVVVPASK